MSGFFNANVTSPFPDANMLFDPAKAQQTAQTIQHNQLGLQAQQLDLTAADHEQVGRLAAGLLNIKDPAARAQAYAQGVGVLQSQGLAKYAPPTLPDEQSLQMLVSQTVPVQDQYKMGIISPPGLTDALARASAPPPGYGGAAAPGGVATTPSATIEPAAFNNATAVRGGLIKRGIDPDTATALAANALHESVANPATGRGDNGNSAGLFQWAGPRLQAYTDTYGHSPDGSPLDEQLDNVVRELKGSEAPAAAKIAEAQGPAAKAAAVSQYYLRPKDTQGEMQRRSATALQLQQQIGGGTTTASAAPTTAQPGQPVPTQVAGPPMVSTAPAAAPGGPAQPAAPTAAPAQPGQPQPAPAPAATAQPGATPLPGTGVNSQQFQTALWKTQQAALLETQFPNSPAAKAKAAELRAEAALYMQADSVITLPNGIQVKALSGQQVDAAKPLPHYVYDAAQHAYIDTTGTNKPEFEPAQRDSAVAQRDVMELGPKVANGTATQAEQARYATAVETYRQPVLRENPVSKETVRVNTRELPAGFPEPPSLGGGGATRGAGTAGGANVVMPGLSPAQQQVERDPAAYKVSESQYDRDSKEIAGIADAGRSAQADQIRINEMQDVLQRFSSGPGTNARTAAVSFLQRWLPAAVTGWEKQSANLSGAEAAQAFSKLALAGAGSAERSVLGNRGGFQAVKMFQAANPNVDLQDATNKSILDMQLISNQANQDYSQGAQAHFAENERNFGGPTHQYKSLAQFDTAWNAQRNPQVFAAAMGAIGGQPASQWTKGLSDDEYARALQIVQRAKPSAVVQTKSGPYSMQPNAVTTGLTAPPGTKVIRFDHNGNVIQ